MIKKLFTTHKETINNFTWRALQIFGKQGITFLIFVISAKLLNPYDFGIYNYILTIVYTLIVFGDFGISAATSKYVAEYNAIDKNKIQTLISNSLIIIVCVGILISLLIIFVGGYILKDKFIYILYALPMIFLSPISSLYDGVFRGLKRFKELAILSLVVSIISIIFVVILVTNNGIYGALISQNLFYLTMVLVLMISYGKLKSKFNPNIIKFILRYSIIIGISSVAYLLYSRIDILVLGYYGYIKEIGYYELTNRLFTLLMLPFLMFAQVIAPNITSYYSRKDYKTVRIKFKKYIYYSAISSIIVVIGSYVIYPFLIKTFFNGYYVNEFIVMMNILLPLFVLKVLGGGIITQGFTTPTGHASLNMKILLITGPLNLVLDLIFINLYGYIGIIYATFVVWLMSSSLLIYIYYYKYLNKNDK